MVLWIMQISLNVLFVAGLVYVFRTRKRLENLEQRKSYNDEDFAGSLELNENREVAPLVLSEPVAHVEIRTTQGQIVEKNKAMPSKSQNIAERYEKAENLLAKGIKIQDVANETGLSVSELRLLEKISTKSH
jgi:cbb3-type cytochrome oxidase subunit 3